MPKATKGAPPLLIEQRKLDSLRQYEKNARRHPQDQVDRLAKSLAEFGWTNPILADEKGEIIAGHGRLAAALSIRHAKGTIRNWPDLTIAPVIVLKGLSTEQRRAYRIADNKLTELGQWDQATLGLELHDLRHVGFDLALTGLGDLELRSLNADASSGFLSGLASNPEGEGAGEGADRIPSGFVQMAFTVRPEERRAVLATLREQQAKRKLPSAAAALLAVCQELRP